MKTVDKMQVIININMMRSKIGLNTLNIDHQLKNSYDVLHEYQNSLVDHYNQALKNGITQVLSVKKYNERRTRDWRNDYDNALKNGRHYSMLPSLGMYLFEKTYGYVAFHKNVAIWGKTKKDAEKLMEDYTNRKLIHLK